MTGSMRGVVVFGFARTFVTISSRCCFARRPSHQMRASPIQPFSVSHGAIYGATRAVHDRDPRDARRELHGRQPQDQQQHGRAEQPERRTRGRRRRFGRECRRPSRAAAATESAASRAPSSWQSRARSRPRARSAAAVRATRSPRNRNTPGDEHEDRETGRPTRRTARTRRRRTMRRPAPCGSSTASSPPATLNAGVDRAVAQRARASRITLKPASTQNADSRRPLMRGTKKASNGVLALALFKLRGS